MMAANRVVGGAAKATGWGGSVRMNGLAGWVKSGSTGTSTGGAGLGSLTAWRWYPAQGAKRSA
jgi:hypothetical protein